MTTENLQSVKTVGVGFAPILKHFFDKSCIAEIIDKNIPPDPRRTKLTHGQAAVAMITGILFQVSQLYKISQFADETTVLKIILPGVSSKEYFDDRLADTLDAIFEYGIGNSELLITKNMIDKFNIETNICHNDTTSVSVYGDCDNNQTDKSIKITFGYSKKHRQDLKQFIWSVSVSSDSGFPLFQKCYNGNTSDVGTYIEQWNNLIELLGRKNFIYVADSKLATFENMTHIDKNEGFFIAPVPMNESYKTVFYKALAEHADEVLIPYKNQLNRGFEVPVTVRHEEKNYQFRMLILFDHGVAERNRNTLKNFVEKTKADFNSITKKLNKYKLKNEQNIDDSCRAVLKKYQTGDFFAYQIKNEPVTIYRNKKRGRTGKNPEKSAVKKDNFILSVSFDEEAFDKALHYCGYYPMITNIAKDALDIESAMMVHKDHYKSEHINRLSKSGYNIEPIYLHTPERIEAFLLLFKTALQLLILIERTCRKNIAERDKGLDDFMPNRQDVRNPTCKNILMAFQYVVCGVVFFSNGQNYGFVSELTDLQKDILSLLDVPYNYFTYEYVNSC